MCFLAPIRSTHSRLCMECYFAGWLRDMLLPFLITSWISLFIEQGYKVGKQVIPLARFKNTDVESGKVCTVVSQNLSSFVTYLVIITSIYPYLSSSCVIHRLKIQWSWTREQLLQELMEELVNRNMLRTGKLLATSIHPLETRVGRQRSQRKRNPCQHLFKRPLIGFLGMPKRYFKRKCCPMLVQVNFVKLKRHTTLGMCSKLHISLLLIGKFACFAVAWVKADKLISYTHCAGILLTGYWCALLVEELKMTEIIMVTKGWTLQVHCLEDFSE